MIRVLIVDDEYIVRLGISSILDWETYGFVVCGTATDGQDALAKIPDLKPDIILADILMQPMNGFRVTVGVFPKIFSNQVYHADATAPGFSLCKKSNATWRM